MTDEPKEVDKDEARASILRHYFAEGINDRQGLVRVATAIAGRWWPSSSACEGHASPMDIIQAVWFNEAQEVVALGPRGGWKTLTLALTAAIEAIFKPGIRIAHASALTYRAAKAQEYVAGFLSSPAVGGLGKKLTLARSSSLRAIRLPNGSSIEFISSTVTGANAIHTNRLFVDEFELIRPEALEEMRMIPTSSGAHPRMIVYLSSRKVRGGNVDKMLQDKRLRDAKRLRYCWVEVTERCPDHRSGTEPGIFEVEDIFSPGGDAPPVKVKAFRGCGECAILPACRTRLKKADGVLPIDDMIATYSSVDTMTWIAQMEGERPTAARAVFVRFEDGRNVTMKAEFNPRYPLLIAVDFAGGNTKTAVLFGQVVEGHLRVVREIVRESGGIDDDVGSVNAAMDRFFPNARVALAIGDSANRLIRMEWNKKLKHFRLAAVRKLKKTEMVEHLRTLIGNGISTRFIVHPRCRNLIDQIGMFRSSDSNSGGSGRSGFFDKNDDCVDAATYLAISVGRVAPKATVWNRGLAPSDTVAEESTSEVPGTEKPEILDFRTYVSDKLTEMLRRGGD